MSSMSVLLVNPRRQDKTDELYIVAIHLLLNGYKNQYFYLKRRLQYTFDIRYTMSCLFKFFRRKHIFEMS